MIYALIIAAVLFLPAPARALDIGTRMPIKFGEVFVVRNDGGIRNWSTYFPYGATCPVEMAIADVAGRDAYRRDRVLLTVDLNGQMAELKLPARHRDQHAVYAGAQTIRRLSRALDDKVFSDLNGMRLKRRPKWTPHVQRATFQVGCTLGEGDYPC